MSTREPTRQLKAPVHHHPPTPRLAMNAVTPGRDRQQTSKVKLAPAKRTATAPKAKKLASGKGKAARSAPDGFPIPLAYLYRDPRPAMVRRQAKAAAAAAGSDSAGQGGDHWTDTDGDGMPIKETTERQREKRTLYTANMAQAAAFEAKYRHGDARDACTRVSGALLLRSHRRRQLAATVSRANCPPICVMHDRCVA